jgi:ATP-dependent Clp protease ATP-binding subunit ClpX
MKTKTGARGLRAILERAMLDIMYELPSMTNLKECVVNENVILKNDKPDLVFGTPEEAAAASFNKKVESA